MVRGLTAVAALLVAVAPAAAQPTAIDPPRIVPWHLIGNVGLAMSRTRVEYAYGQPTHEPEFTDVAGTGLFTYRGGGDLGVFYEQGHVVWIETHSSYYRTRDHFGVGSRVPLRPCHRTTRNPCEHRWNGFVLRPATVYESGGIWKHLQWFKSVAYGKRHVLVQFEVSRGVVQWIWVASM